MTVEFIREQRVSKEEMTKVRRKKKKNKLKGKRKNEKETQKRQACITRKNTTPQPQA